MVSTACYPCRRMELRLTLGLPVQTSPGRKVVLTDTVRAQVLDGLAGSDVTAEGDGSRMQIRVVSDCFEGLSRVKRQQQVYGCIDGLIAGGELHAVTIVALTPTEAANPA